MADNGKVTKEPDLAVPEIVVDPPPDGGFPESPPFAPPTLLIFKKVIPERFGSVSWVYVGDYMDENQIRSAGAGEYLVYEAGPTMLAADRCDPPMPKLFRAKRVKGVKPPKEPPMPETEDLETF